MGDLGLEIAVDGIGNVVATRPGTDPTAAPVMTGSHIDTVATGGRFDGNLGVLAGLEVIETLEQHGVPTVHPLAVGFFTDEEGSRFAPDMLGSLVFVGGMALEEALDIHAVDDGARLGDELGRIGYAGPLPCPTAAAPHAYVELHIEQGPILEDEGDHDRRRRRRPGDLVDRADDHRSLGPRRHDADAPPARRRATSPRRSPCTPAGWRSSSAAPRWPPSAGSRSIPTSSTSCPARRRSPSTCATPTRSCCVRPSGGSPTEVTGLADAEGVTVSTRSLARFEPVEFDPATVELVESTAHRLGLSTRRMPSGAGHDAQMLARICPAAMIFTPSVGGLSHNIGEHTHPADVAAGADVLLQTLLTLAGAHTTS